jgi:uncharacterized protein (DUF1800 family)
MDNCVNSTLQPYLPSTDGWNAAHIGHLYRSFGHGATYDQIQSGLSMTPQELVDQLIDEAINSPQPETPYWSEYNSEDYEDTEGLAGEHYYATKYNWTLRGTQFPFHHKMSVFWHDHFSTERQVYNCNSFLWSYYSLINKNAFGNFRTFVEEMGLNEAMLVYLDGNDNVVGQPNENYARELMELFTMGENNGYTQNDIEEVAKALTGYRLVRYLCNLGPEFIPSKHDDSIKTIFGQTGNFGYDDVHELIFTLRKTEVANYICTKLYHHFIYRNPDQSIIDGLAATFIANDWEIVPVLRQLFASEHFFETVFHGAKIKSPIELLLQLVNTSGLTVADDFDEGFLGYLDYIMRQMGQNLFNPPNVAGWPGHRFWLSENALAYRWSYCQSILNNYLNDNGKEKLRLLAIQVSDSISDPLSIAIAMTELLIGVPLDQELIDVAVLHLKAGIPENYFEDESWNLYWEEAPDQLINMYKFLIQLPEYQLT